MVDDCRAIALVLMTFLMRYFKRAPMPPIPCYLHKMLDKISLLVLSESPLKMDDFDSTRANPLKDGDAKPRV